MLDSAHVVHEARTAPPQELTGSGDDIQLSVVLPCLNEAETLAVCIKKALTSIDELGIRGEVVVADNGSTDGSQQIAADCGARVVDVAEKGYGAALMGGIRAASGTYVIMADADDSYDLSGLEPFYSALQDGADLVVGNRFKGGIEKGAMPALHRYLGNPVLSFVGRLFFHSDLGDFHCGLRGFRRDAILALGLRTTGMEFASEMIVRASASELDIREVPTTLRPDGRSRRPHLRTWRDGWRHLRFLLLFSPRWLFLYPGMLLMLVGVVAGALQLPGPDSASDVSSHINRLVVSSAAVLVGFTAVLFAVCARVFTMQEGLLPAGPKLRRAFAYIRLESGILVGTVLIVCGLVIGAAGVLASGDVSSLMETWRTVRVVIPAATAVTLGVEVVLGSFLLSVLGLPRR
jgi:hypothetical protein